MIDITQEKIDVLPTIYLERLEEKVVSLLADELHVGPSEAMRIYYASELSKQVARGDYGIQFRSPENLVADLLENESPLCQGKNKRY